MTPSRFRFQDDLSVTKEGTDPVVGIKYYRLSEKFPLLLSFPHGAGTFVHLRAGFVGVSSKRLIYIVPEDTESMKTYGVARSGDIGLFVHKLCHVEVVYVDNGERDSTGCRWVLRPVITERQGYDIMLLSFENYLEPVA